MPWINESCKNCGICINKCPENAIEVKNNKLVINQDKCTKCGKCLSLCPVQAIRPNSENPSLRKNKNRRG